MRRTDWLRYASWLRNVQVNGWGLFTTMSKEDFLGERGPLVGFISALNVLSIMGARFLTFGEGNCEHGKEEK